MNNNSSSTATGDSVWIKYPTPCPTCGKCPTCGAYKTQPYWPVGPFYPANPAYPTWYGTLTSAGSAPEINS